MWTVRTVLNVRPIDAFKHQNVVSISTALIILNASTTSALNGPHVEMMETVFLVSDA